MKTLTEYTEKQTTELLAETGAFFAFNTKQFNEKKVEGVKYISIGSGLICPKGNVETLKSGLDEIYKNGIAQDIAENGKEKIIERELYNHEAFYTWNIQSTFDALVGYEITVEEVRAVFNKLKGLQD